MLLRFIRQFEELIHHRVWMCAFGFLALVGFLVGIYVYSFVYAASSNCEDINTGGRLGPDCVISEIYEE